MVALILTTVSECASYVGGSMHILALRRCAPVASGQASPRQRLAPADSDRPGAARAARTVEGSDPPQSEGLVRARGCARSHTHAPRPRGRSPSINPCGKASVRRANYGGFARSPLSAGLAQPAGWSGSVAREADLTRCPVLALIRCLDLVYGLRSTLLPPPPFRGWPISSAAWPGCLNRNRCATAVHDRRHG